MRRKKNSTERFFDEESSSNDDIHHPVHEMLSNREIKQIRSKLRNNPSKNLRRKLKKKLTEHEYASKYLPFEPLPHHLQFINETTSEQTLYRMIEIASSSTTFLLDTESTLVYRERNRPSLIQLQLCPSNDRSTIVIIEVNYLPSPDSNEFQLVKEIFRIVLGSKNDIFTWGSIEELNDFLQFNLFDSNQIYKPRSENLQQLFKIYWQQHHQHEITNDCLCEPCIGKSSTESWSLQSAVAYLLMEWLDKGLTCAGFDIGLDPNLNPPNDDQFEYRTALTNYAANDCLAMEKILIHMEERSLQTQLPDGRTNHIENQRRSEESESSSSSDDANYHWNIGTQVKQDRIVYFLEESQLHVDEYFDEEPQVDRFEELEPSTHRTEQHQCYDHRQRTEQRQTDSHQEQHFQSESWYERDSSKEIVEEEQRRSPITEQRDPIFTHSSASVHRTEMEKKKRRNHRCTIKQRIRNYRHEIIRRNIDRRFSISMVKEILRRYEIPHVALNISKSQITGRKSLYIGIRDKTMINEYQSRIHDLFTTDYYNEFRARNRI